ncbi:FkbM family methyltransferase [Roseomonas sp. GCM10028921]
MPPEVASLSTMIVNSPLPNGSTPLLCVQARSISNQKPTNRSLSLRLFPFLQRRRQKLNAVVLPPSPPAAYPPRELEHLTPSTMTADERIAMGTRCRDADPVPKVPGAGGVEVGPDGQRIQVMHNGIRVLADGYYGAWMTRLIELCRGHHEAQEERVFHEVVSRLPEGGTMIELGGFWALYSIWFLRSAPGRRAVLVEPDPAHIAIGEANLALNGVSAEFVHGFVGEEPGSCRAFSTEESGVVEIPCFDVASLMARYCMDRLTILHCDAQGAEFKVLEQAAPLMRAGKIDWVFVSTHHHSISGDPLTHQRCLTLLRSLGGQIEAEHSVQESFSGDGLICARFCPAPAGWTPIHLSYNRASQSLFRDPLYDLAQQQPPKL